MSSDQVLEELLSVVDSRYGTGGPSDQWGEVGSKGEGNGAAKVEAVGLEHAGLPPVPREQVSPRRE
jgi:hypothetical protein